MPKKGRKTCFLEIKLMSQILGNAKPKDKVTYFNNCFPSYLFQTCQLLQKQIIRANLISDLSYLLLLETI